MDKEILRMGILGFLPRGRIKRVVPNSEPVGETSVTPWLGTPPDVEIYELRGCRVLSKSKWAAMANVTIEYDWGVRQKFRFENFCYCSYPLNRFEYRLNEVGADWRETDIYSYLQPGG